MIPPPPPPPKNLIEASYEKSISWISLAVDCFLRLKFFVFFFLLEGNWNTLQGLTL